MIYFFLLKGCIITTKNVTLTIVSNSIVLAKWPFAMVWVVIRPGLSCYHQELFSSITQWTHWSQPSSCAYNLASWTQRFLLRDSAFTNVTFIISLHICHVMLSQEAASLKHYPIRGIWVVSHCFPPLPPSKKSPLKTSTSQHWHSKAHQAFTTCLHACRLRCNKRSNNLQNDTI